MTVRPVFKQALKIASNIDAEQLKVHLRVALPYQIQRQFKGFSCISDV